MANDDLVEFLFDACPVCHFVWDSCAHRPPRGGERIPPPPAFVPPAVIPTQPTTVEEMVAAFERAAAGK